MKASVIYENGGPEVLRYEDVAEPDCPDGHVIVDAEAISIEGGDLLARAGVMPTKTPHVVGYLSAGVVTATADGVESPSVGDRVIALGGDGSHAARRAVPAPMTWPIPDGLGAAEAACIPVAFGTAHECLFGAAGLQEGQTVLIHGGAGGVGMAAIQLASRVGATVIATASSDEKLDRLKDLGLDHGVNYSEGDFAGRVRELTEGSGVNVVLDPVGGQVLTESVSLLDHRGSIVSVGVAGRAETKVDAMSLWWRNNSVHGVYLGGMFLSEYESTHRMVGKLIEQVAEGELRVVIDRTFPLAEAAEAHTYIESRKAFGRVVLEP